MDDINNSEFKKYGIFVVPLLVVTFSIILIYQVFIPQFYSILDSRDKIEQKKESLSRLSEINSYLGSIPDGLLDKYLAIADDSYLSYGDIISIYSGISSSAFSSNVNISNFSIVPGYVYRKNENVQTTDLQGNVNINITVNSDNNRNIVLFGKSLYTALPLFEVKSINYKEKDAVYEISAYRKPYEIKTLSKIGQIKEITNNQKKMLDRLEQWKKEMELLKNKGVDLPVASGSGKTINNP